MSGDTETMQPELKSALLLLYKDTTIMEMRRFNNESSFRPTYKEVLYMYGIGSVEKCTATDLVKMFNISKETMSIALSKMETKGFIERTVDPEDNRRQIITISDKRFFEMRSQQTIYEEALKKLIAKYTDDEIKTASNVIVDLADEMKRISDMRASY